jgi:uncharacterized protein (DUF4415 family)
MAKKQSGSSRREKLTSMSLEESRAYAKTPKHKAALKRLAAMKDEDIDYSDIPPLSDEQLAAMVRADRYRPVKRTITIRVDVDVLEWLKNKSGGAGYQTKLNALLRRLMLREAKR